MNQINDLSADVAAVLAIPGTSVPDSYTAAFAGYNHAAAVRDLPLDDRIARVAEVVATADSDAIDRALREYEAEAALVRDYDLFTGLERSTTARARAAYNTVAADNYEAVRTAWQVAADALTQAAQLIDTAAPFEEVLHAPTAARDAWEAAPTLARDLDTLTATLTRAAVLAGAYLAEASLSANDWPMSLTVDATGLHRRRVWEAWGATDHRALRWGALLGLGANLTAPGLGGIHPYRRPVPIETRYEAVAYGRQAYQFDPEDNAPDPRQGARVGANVGGR